MTPPLVSIIIPLYNREELVKETLDSVLAQTYPHWECIIVDDVSTDNSLATAQEYAARDSRFKVFQRHREPKGAPTCRNIGFEKSKGEYIIFLDSDDLLADFCLEKRIEKFTKHRDLDFLVFSTLEFKKEINDTNILVNVPNEKDPIERLLNLDVPWLITDPIWHRNSFNRLGGFDERALSWQDWELHLRALLLGFHFLYFSDVDNYLRRDRKIETMGDSALSNKHLLSHIRLIAEFKPLIAHKKDYRICLNGLLEWIGCKALYSNGSRAIALRAYWLSIDKGNFYKPLFNIISIILRKKVFYVNKSHPNFGTMRQIRIDEKEVI